MATTAYSLLVSIFLLRIFHHSGETSVPNWIRLLVLTYIRRLLFFDSKEKHKSVHSVDMEISKGQQLKVEDIDNTVTATGHVLPSEIIVAAKRYLQKDDTDASEDEKRSDWQMVAKILDRFFFVLSLLFVLIMSIITFVRLRLNV